MLKIVKKIWVYAQSIKYYSFGDEYNRVNMIDCILKEYRKIIRKNSFIWKSFPICSALSICCWIYIFSKLRIQAGKPSESSKTLSQDQFWLQFLNDPKAGVQAIILNFCTELFFHTTAPFTNILTVKKQLVEFDTTAEEGIQFIWE